jgi:hypothetical protein
MLQLPQDLRRSHRRETATGNHHPVRQFAHLGSTLIVSLIVMTPSIDKFRAGKKQSFVLL